jgi:hypothetical protein
MRKLFVSIMFPFLLSAQSQFIDNAVLGVKADYIFLINNDLQERGGGLGVSLFSIVDIGFKYAVTTYEQKGEIKLYSRSVYAAYNFRSNNNSMKIILGYSHNSVNIEQFNFPRIELDGPFLGFNISPKIYENNSISIIPGFNFSMAFLSSAKKDDAQNHSVNAGIELSVVSKINKEFYFVLAPSIAKSLSHSDFPVIYGVNLGLLFNIPKK